MNSYVKFSNIKGNKLVQLKTGKSKNGIYNIQYINNCITLRSEKCSQEASNSFALRILTNQNLWNNIERR
jgi:hypothetical protein